MSDIARRAADTLFPLHITVGSIPAPEQEWLDREFAKIRAQQDHAERIIAAALAESTAILTVERDGWRAMIDRIAERIGCQDVCDTDGAVCERLDELEAKREAMTGRVGELHELLAHMKSCAVCAECWDDCDTGREALAMLAAPPGNASESLGEGAGGRG